MRDFSKLNATVDHLRMNPDKHDQGTWLDGGRRTGDAPPEACGSTACLAGTGMLMHQPELLNLEFKGDAVVMNPDLEGYQFADDPGGFDATSNWFLDKGAELFGLTESEARLLFLTCQDLESIEAVVKDLNNGVEDIELLRATVDEQEALRLEDDVVELAGESAQQDGQYDMDVKYMNNEIQHLRQRACDVRKRHASGGPVVIRDEINQWATANA